MLNKSNERELAYLVYVDDITPMNADRLECAHIGGWNCVVGKGEFKKGDIAIFFEIDSKLPEVEPFTAMEFLASKHFKIKSQKIRSVTSQGLLVHPQTLGWPTICDETGAMWVVDKEGGIHAVEDESRFLTQKLGVTYAVVEDNARKASSGDKYKKMAQRHPKLARKVWWRWLMRRDWGKKLLFAFFGKKRDKKTEWPDGKFPGVKRTDQERVENMVWVLNDKTPYIRTQKCDGSSATYILERKGHNKFEFYVCSRNVRMLRPDQECFFGAQNYYWDAAIKYNIERKMKDYLLEYDDLTFVCWQGELCAPAIQKNPHHLKDLHLYCFHWTDDNGRWDIRDAKEWWENIGMEVVPVDDELYIMPDDFEEFKLTADGTYDPSVCEGLAGCPREGFVYYKTTDPNFSFKNVSREYLLKH